MDIPKIKRSAQAAFIEALIDVDVENKEALAKAVAKAIEKAFEESEKT